MNDDEKIATSEFTESLRGIAKRQSELYELGYLNYPEQLEHAATMLERDYGNDDFLAAVAGLLRGRFIPKPTLSKFQIRLAEAYRTRLRDNLKKPKRRQKTRTQLYQEVQNDFRLESDGTVKNAVSKYKKHHEAARRLINRNSENSSE